MSNTMQQHISAPTKTSINNLNMGFVMVFFSKELLCKSQSNLHTFVLIPVARIRCTFWFQMNLKIFNCNINLNIVINDKIRNHNILCLMLKSEKMNKNSKKYNNIVLFVFSSYSNLFKISIFSLHKILLEKSRMADYYYEVIKNRHSDLFFSHFDSQSTTHLLSILITMVIAYTWSTFFIKLYVTH